MKYELTKPILKILDCQDAETSFIAFTIQQTCSKRENKTCFVIQFLGFFFFSLEFCKTTLIILNDTVVFISTMVINSDEYTVRANCKIQKSSFAPW